MTNCKRRWKSLSQDKILSLLGLAKKSGNIASGEFATEKAVKTGGAFLVVVANDASDNTKKLFSDKCSFYNVPIEFYSDKAGLGHALGYEMRTSLAVLDSGFADSLIKKIKER